MESHNLKIYENLFDEIANGNRKWRIGIYVRLSKDDGNSVSLSIVNQIKLIARYLRQMDDFIVIDIFIDDGLTGTDFDREDYQRLQNYVDSKLVNCIIVKDLTRYSRNMVDGIKELDEYVLEKKIRFIACGHPFVDTLKDPTQISSPEVYQALQAAEDHARITSKKVRDIKAIKRDDGEKNGGFPPYGYLPNPDGQHWLYDPVAGEIVKMMFQWSLEGMSDAQIAKKLNEMGVPNPTAYKQNVLGLNYHNPQAKNNSGLWWPTSVGYILADKNYIGASVQGKSSCFDHKRHKQIRKKKDEYVVVPNSHEKAIDEELFGKVGEIRAQRTRVTKSTGKVHIFANLVYCANCKRGMKKTGAKEKQYLVCRTYKELGDTYCGKKRTISFEKLETIVLEVIKKQIAIVIDLKSIVETVSAQTNINNKSHRLEQMITNTKKQIEKTEHIYDVSYIDWKNEDISKEQFQRIRTDTEKKLTQYRDSLEKLVEENYRFQQGINSNNTYFDTFIKYQNITSLDRLVLLELIEKIYIHEDKSIEIEFKYKDQYQLILDYIEQNTNDNNYQKKLEKKQ